MTTKIAWCDETLNIVTGCTPVSEGCKNCYAAGVAKRFWGERKFSDIRIHGDRIHKPFTWKKPRRVFVNSMSDLFHDDVPFKFIDRAFGVMALCPEHSFMILTKRPERMKEYFQYVAEQNEPVLSGEGNIGYHITSDLLMYANSFPGGVANWRYEEPEYDDAHDGHRVSVPGYWEYKGPEKVEDLVPWPLRNVYLGVTAESQQMADERIPILLETPAVVRFVSVEPMLEAVDINRWLQIAWQCSGCHGYFPHHWRKVCPSCGKEDYWCGSHKFNPSNGIGQVGPGISWIIAGAESGPKRRPFDLDWARSLRDQCQAAGVPFFFKQGHDESGKVVHMPELDGVVHAELPEAKQ